MSPQKYLKALVAGLTFTGMFAGKAAKQKTEEPDRYPRGHNKDRENARHVRQGLNRTAAAAAKEKE